MTKGSILILSLFQVMNKLNIIMIFLISFFVLDFDKAKAQNSERILDSVYLNKLVLKNAKVYKKIEKDLKKNEIVCDTMFLTAFYLSKSKKLLYVYSNENYDDTFHVLKLKGYFFINNVCIIVLESEDFNEINLFDFYLNTGKYFSYNLNYRRVYCHGDKFGFEYKIKIKKAKSKSLKR